MGLGLNNFGVLRDTVVVSICPVPGPGVIWALEGRSVIKKKKVGRDMGSELIG